MATQNSCLERIHNVQKSGLADEVIIEEYEGQKIFDIQRYQVDIFAIGSDWLGKFDYLNDYCQVVYLDRTKGVSSTQLRNESGGVMRVGIVGAGRIAARFVAEARYVSGVSVEAVYTRNYDKAKQMLVDVFGLSKAVGITSRVAFLENYDLSVAAPVYRREHLGRGQQTVGPALVVEDTATTFLASDWRLEVDDYGNLRLEA